MFKISHLLILLIQILQVRTNTFHLNTERQLIHTLLNQYDKNQRSARPLKDSSGSLKLNMTLFLLRLLDLDPKGQFMTTVIEVHFSWLDEFLKWNKTEYNNLDLITLNVNDIWTPSLTVTNLVEPYSNFNPVDKVLVDSSGRVFLDQIEILKTFCDVDVTYFPFEHETCELIFSNLVQDSQSVFINYIPYKDGSFEGFHGFSDKEDEWEIIETSQRIFRNYTSGNVIDKNLQ